MSIIYVNEVNRLKEKHVFQKNYASYSLLNDNMPALHLQGAQSNIGPRN